MPKPDPTRPELWRIWSQVEACRSQRQSWLLATSPAWGAALAVAKDKNNLYAGDDVEHHTREDLDLQARGLEILANYQEVYASVHLTREAVAHAVSFYRAFAIRFPVNSSADVHMDLFVTRYFELMTHERGVRAATVEEVKHRLSSTEHLHV